MTNRERKNKKPLKCNFFTVTLSGKAAIAMLKKKISYAQKILHQLPYLKRKTSTIKLIPFRFRFLKQQQQQKG